MKGDNNLLDTIIQAILNVGKGSLSSVYVMKEFNCTNIFLEFGKPQKWTNPLYVHHEIEMGSFAGNWRVLVDDQVVLASQDSLDEAEFDCQLRAIRFGAIRGLVMLSSVDVRAVFEGGVQVDFVCCTQEDDVFHCFLPGNRVVVFNPIKGWREEKANKTL